MVLTREKGEQAMALTIDDIAELLTDYTQFLYEHCYLDADYCMKAPSPVLEFLNKNYRQIYKYVAKEERQKHCAIDKNKILEPQNH